MGQVHRSNESVKRNEAKVKAAPTLQRLCRMTSVEAITGPRSAARRDEARRGQAGPDRATPRHVNRSKFFIVSIVKTKFWIVATWPKSTNPHGATSFLHRSAAQRSADADADADDSDSVHGVTFN